MNRLSENKSRKQLGGYHSYSGGRLHRGYNNGVEMKCWNSGHILGLSDRIDTGYEKRGVKHYLFVCLFMHQAIRWMGFL